MISATGCARCWPGSATAHSVVARAQQRAEEARRVLRTLHADDDVQRPVAPSRRHARASAAPAAALCPPSSHSSQSGGSRRAASAPCRRCSRAGQRARASPSPSAAGGRPGPAARIAASAMPALSIWCGPAQRRQRQVQRAGRILEPQAFAAARDGPVVAAREQHRALTRRLDREQRQHLRRLHAGRDRHAGLDDARLLRRDLRQRVAQPLAMVDARSR